jgi:general secretion pathway protein J
MNKQAGFTLIEALVALVILSGVFSVVWTWFNTAVISSEKVERAVAMPRLFDQFVDHISLQSLQNQREGEVQFDGYKLQWQAEPQRSSVDENFKRQPTWHVVLFYVSIDVYSNNEKITSWQTQQVDYWRSDVPLPNFDR